MKEDLIDIVMKIIFIVIAIILIYWMLQTLFGGSPTLSQMNTSFIIGIVAILFTTMIHFSKMNREIGEIKISQKHNFYSIKNDIKEIKDKL